MTKAQRSILWQVYGCKFGTFPAQPPHEGGWYLFGKIALKAGEILQREGLIQIIGTSESGYTAVPVYPDRS